MLKYIIATRPLFVITSLVPFTLGAFLALRGGHFSWILYLLGALTLFFVHSGAHSANDYFDYKHSVDRPGDLAKRKSRLLLNGEISLKAAKYVTVTWFALALASGLSIVFLSTPYILLFGLTGLLIGYFYTADPVNLKYRGLSVPAIFTIYGPLITIGGYFLMTKSITQTSVIFSLIIGFPITNIVLANEIRDTANDREVGIKSLSILFGDMKGTEIYIILFATQFIGLFHEILNGLVSPLGWISVASVPFYAAAMAKLIKKSRGKADEMEIKNVDVLSLVAMLLFGVGLFLGLITL